jgi:hypothetical protein
VCVVSKVYGEFYRKLTVAVQDQQALCSSRMLTYAGLCCRMLTYADVC